MMMIKLTHQLKEPERDCEGIEFQVEGSNGSDVVISSQLKGEKRISINNSRFTNKKIQEFVDVSRFNPKYFENIMTLKQARQLVRYNETEFQKPFGV